MAWNLVSFRFRSAHSQSQTIILSQCRLWENAKFKTARSVFLRIQATAYRDLLDAGQRSTDQSYGEAFDVALPSGAQLEELYPVPFSAINKHWNQRGEKRYRLMFEDYLAWETHVTFSLSKWAGKCRLLTGCGPQHPSLSLSSSPSALLKTKHI